MEDVIFCNPNVWDEGARFKMSGWGLRWVEPYNISYPEAKINQLDIPGRDGVFESTWSRHNYNIKYGNRTMELTFAAADKDYADFERRKYIISTNFHGKRWGVILTVDSRYMYIGRFKLDAQKSSRVESTFTLTGDMEPFKYVRGEKYKQIVLNDSTVTREVNFPELGFDQIPEIELVHGDAYVSSEMDGKYERELNNIERIYPDVWLRAAGGALYFRGNGVVRIYTKRGVL